MQYNKFALQLRWTNNSEVLDKYSHMLSLITYNTVNHSFLGDEHIIPAMHNILKFINPRRI